MGQKRGNRPLKKPTIRTKQAHEAEPGDLALVCRDQAPGALPNGTRVRKCWAEPSDTNPVGTMGVVIGSLGPMDPPVNGIRYGYFVCWDPRPELPVFCIEKKIESLPPDA
jgi:hypothetical protein